MKVSTATDSDGTEARTRPADLTLHETSDGWRLTISSEALARLAALGDGADGKPIPVAGGELTMELHPNLVPGAPFDITGVVVSEVEHRANPRP